MMPFCILSWTGKVEEHFPRHVQGLELRKNSRRTPENLIRGPAEAKEPQKKARAGLGLHKQVGRVAGRRQASLEEEARRRPEKRAWAARGWVSGAGALGQIRDLLQALDRKSTRLNSSH